MVASGTSADEQRSAFSALRAKPGRREELVAALEPMLSSALGESGMVDYVLHRQDDDADVVWFFARFADQAALDEHQAREAAFGDEVRPLLAVLDGPPQTVYGSVLWSEGRADDGTRHVRAVALS